MYNYSYCNLRICSECFDPLSEAFIRHSTQKGFKIPSFNIQSLTSAGTGPAPEAWPSGRGFIYVGTYVSYIHRTETKCGVFKFVIRENEDMKPLQEAGACQTNVKQLNCVFTPPQ